jgi:putative ABC transport system permease protein
VMEQVRTVPGVEAVAVASNLPLQRGLNMVFRRQGEGAEVPSHYTDWRYVTPEYRNVLRIPVVQGRWFTQSDTGSSPYVAVVNQTLVRRYFKNESALGQMIDFGETPKAGAGPRLLQIVGIVPDVKEHSLDEESDPMVYVPAAQVSDEVAHTVHSWFKVSWLIRTRGTVPQLDAVLRKAILAVDPNQPLVTVEPLEAVRGATLARSRFQAVLLSLFALLALVLAAVGLASIMAYSVAERRREFAVRMALGAAPAGVFTLVLRHAILLCAGGLAAGLTMALFTGKLLNSFLYGVTSTDTISYLAASLSLLFVGITSALIPALRIFRMNPSAILRAE